MKHSENVQRSVLRKLFFWKQEIVLKVCSEMLIFGRFFSNLSVSFFRHGLFNFLGHIPLNLKMDSGKSVVLFYFGSNNNDFQERKFKIIFNPSGHPLGNYLHIFTGKCCFRELPIQNICKRHRNTSIENFECKPSVQFALSHTTIAMKLTGCVGSVYSWMLARGFQLELNGVEQHWMHIHTHHSMPFSIFSDHSMHI